MASGSSLRPLYESLAAGLAILIFAAGVSIISSRQFGASQSLLELIIFLAVGMPMTGLGYLFKSRHRAFSLGWLSRGFGLSASALILLGFGLVFGPAQLYVNGYPQENLGVGANTIIFLLAAVFGGLKFAPFLIIGAAVNRQEIHRD